MRKVIKQGVRMKRMICGTCGQIELISMEEMGVCSNCGERMEELKDLMATKIPEPEEIIAKEPPLCIEKPEERQEETPAPGPGQPVKKEDNRTCSSCMHCTEKAGHGRGMQYKCGLSGTWFLSGLGCDAWRDR